MQHDSWSWSMLVREASRNTFSSSARMFPVLAVAVLLGAGQTALLVHQSDELDTTLMDLQLAGRNVLVMTPPTQDSISSVTRTSCEDLTRHAVVERAGLVSDQTVRLDTPELGALVQSQQLSPTLLPALEEYDAVIGSALWPGDESILTVRTPDGQVLEAAVGTDQPTGVPVNSAINTSLGVDVTEGNYCVAMLDSYLPSSEARTIVMGELRLTGDPLMARPALDESLDVIALHLARTERFLPLAVSVLAAFSVFALSRFRSSEFAAYRLSGTSRRSLATIVFLEQAIVAGFYLASATAATLVLGLHLRDPSVPILWAVTGALAWTVASGASATACLFRRTSDLAKDR